MINETEAWMMRGGSNGAGRGIFYFSNANYNGDASSPYSFRLVATIR